MLSGCCWHSQLARLEDRVRVLVYESKRSAVRALALSITALPSERAALQASAWWRGNIWASARGSQGKSVRACHPADACGQAAGKPTASYRPTQTHGLSTQH